MARSAAIAALGAIIATISGLALAFLAYINGRTVYENGSYYILQVKPLPVLLAVIGIIIGIVILVAEFASDGHPVLTCPNCRRRVESEWRVCPYCNAILRFT